MSTMSWIRRPADYGNRPVPEPEPTPTVLGRSTQRSIGPSSTTRGLFEYHTQNPVAVNPVLEQPKLDWTSLRQPITVEGWRRWVRTGMHASMPFQGRVYAAGRMWNNFMHRDRITAPGSRGFTYAQAQQPSGPGTGRTIQVQAGGPGGQGPATTNQGGPMGSIANYISRQGKTTPPPRPKKG